jgi:integrase
VTVKFSEQEELPMLSDGTLRGIKPQATTYKIADRDGMYVTVSPKGTITFRLDYRLNGRRETLTIGRYGPKDGISLLMARERCVEARAAIAEGQSPSQEKQREKRRVAEAKTFESSPVAGWKRPGWRTARSRCARASSTGTSCRCSATGCWPRSAPEDLRNLCAKVKARGAPATAVHVRDIVKQVFGFAALHGDKASNPADEVGPSSIATFVAKDRALSPSEIRVMHRVLDTTATLPTIRLALRLILLTLVRKSELIEATWDEVDFANALWTIPKSRMKAGKPHNVYLSQQALDIMVALRTCASGSRFLLPSRYDADRCMSKATLNRVTQVVGREGQGSETSRWSRSPCTTCAVRAPPS